MPNLKHTLESDDGSSGHKRPRRSQDVVLNEKILEEAQRVLNLIPTMETDVKKNHSQNAAKLLEILQCWNVACTYAKDTNMTKWSDIDLSFLDLCLPPSSLPFKSYNNHYETFSVLQKGKLLSLPGPSVFGKHWSQYQSFFKDRILCLRPSGSFGLPLCTLHDVFRRYSVTVQKPLPHESESVKLATRAAIRLCSSMGQSFSKENDGSAAPRMRDQHGRILEFDECLRGALDAFQKSVPLNPKCDRTSGIVDGVLSMGKVTLSMRKMKGDVGSSGDPYMQMTRTYDMAVKVAQESSDPAVQTFLKHGAPMFLLCVNGPEFMVAGGFCDGDKVIVEPLGDICIMLEDCTDQRVEKLTRVLYALDAGIKELRRLVTQNLAAIFPSSIPRIYKSCVLYNHSQSGHLTFTSKLESPNAKRMAFNACLSIPSSPSVPVFVKLVNGRYGEDVHQLLAVNKLAPILYGVSQLEGAPTAYVMEHLDNLSWVTLAAYSKLPHRSTDADSIRLSIDKVLKVLHEKRKVHGDLRSPNIMVNVSPTGEVILVQDDLGYSRANIMVVDFDWAGDAGKVYYPPSRNPDLQDLTWPGEPGGSIMDDHDRKLVDSWWWTTFGKGG